jgi:hypothetical protein
MTARWIVGLLALAVLLGAAPARAADPSPLAPRPAPPPRPVRLDYRRGPGAERCPEEQAFRDHAGAYAQTSGDLFAPDAAARLVVTLGRRGYGYEGTAVIYDAAGAVFWSNTFPPATRAPAASCADLVDSLALSFTYQIDPIVPVPLQPAPPPVVQPAAVPPRPAPPPLPAQSEPFAFRFGAAAVVDLATAPRPAVGLSFGLGFRVSWFSLEMEGRWDPPAGAIIEGADLSTTRFVGALIPCGHAGYFVGCALAEVGPIWGTVTGAGVTTGTQKTLYVATGGRLGAEIPIAPHLVLRAVGDLLLALQTTAFRIDTQRRWETPAVAAGFSVGLLASF